MEHGGRREEGGEEESKGIVDDVNWKRKEERGGGEGEGRRAGGGRTRRKGKDKEKELEGGKGGGDGLEDRTLGMEEDLWGHNLGYLSRPPSSPLISLGQPSFLCPSSAPLPPSSLP